MPSTVRWAGLALVALTALAPHARAADSTATAPADSIVLAPADSIAAPAESTPTAPTESTPAAPPRLTTGSIPGHAGLTGLLGGSWIWADGDYGRGALPRFDFSGSWRYQMTPRWRFQFSPGFTWNAYTKHVNPPFVDPNYPNDLTKQHYLVQLVPMSAQLQWTSRTGNTMRHLGVGPGLYRVLVQHHRRDLLDPVTFKVHRGVYLGATAEVGVERFFKGLPNTAFEFNVAAHAVNAKRDDQFPNGWNAWLTDVAIRAGASYYFDVSRLAKKKPTPLPMSTGDKAGR
jgi:hypothetical protein